MGTGHRIRCHRFWITAIMLLALPAAVQAAAPTCGKLIRDRCVTCHSEARICSKVTENKDLSTWQNTVTTMIEYGAQVNGDEEKQLVRCLSTADKEVLRLCGMKE